METVRTWQDNEGTVSILALMPFTIAVFLMGVTTNLYVSEWLLDQTGLGLLCSLGVVVVVILLLSAGYLRKRSVCAPVLAAQ